MAGLRREALEEAGLDMTKAYLIDSGPTLTIDRPVEEGWQRESLFVLDAQLPLEFQPDNCDGEVSAFKQLDQVSALRLALSGQMTADASTVLLDFLRRRR
jgi:8-oxo-dGTP pyrophosphatase MutT (NUDIX family)